MKLAYLFWALSPSFFSLTAYGTVSKAEVEKAQQDIAEYKRLKNLSKENPSADKNKALSETKEEQEEEVPFKRRNQEFRPLSGDNPYYREHQSPSSRLGNRPLNLPRGTTSVK